MNKNASCQDADASIELFYSDQVCWSMCTLCPSGWAKTIIFCICVYVTSAFAAGSHFLASSQHQGSVATVRRQYAVTHMMEVQLWEIR